MGKRYGMPYMGSKNTIAEWVISNLPNAETLYDLFGGGGAITHCAAESGKYNKIVYNELNSVIYQLFRDAVRGQLEKETRWIDRQTFNDLKDINGYIANVWSFGNKGTHYLYSKEIEPWKKAFHYAVMHEDYSYFKLMGIDDILLTGLYPHERRLELRAQILKNKDEYKEKYIKWYVEHFLNENIDVLHFNHDLNLNIEHLERLERIQRLEHIERIGTLCTLNTSYENVHISNNSIIYCDIPYNGTEEYKDCIFNYEKFYDWSCSQKVPVYISEYNIDDDRFEIVAEKQRRSTMCSKNNNLYKIERLYKVRG